MSEYNQDTTIRNAFVEIQEKFGLEAERLAREINIAFAASTILSLQNPNQDPFFNMMFTNRTENVTPALDGVISRLADATKREINPLTYDKEAGQFVYRNKEGVSCHLNSENDLMDYITRLGTLRHQNLPKKPPIDQITLMRANSVSKERMTEAIMLASEKVGGLL